MTSPAEVPGTNAELIQAAGEFADAVKCFKGDHAEHLRLLKKVDKLRVLLENPMDIIMKQWETSICIAAMNLLVELGVLEAIPKDGSISSKELAKIVNVDESAIGMTTGPYLGYPSTNLDQLAR